MRSITLAAVLCLVIVPAALAKVPACRDAKGHFTKCPPAAAAPVPSSKPGQCRDAKGHFMKCAPGPSASTPTGTATSSMGASAPTAHPKQCKKGKPCGNTCISLKDICHK